MRCFDDFSALWLHLWQDFILTQPIGQWGGVGKHGLSGADSVTTIGSDNGEEKKTFKQQPSGGSKGLHAAAPNTQIQSKQTCWACDMAQRRKG